MRFDAGFVTVSVDPARSDQSLAHTPHIGQLTEEQTQTIVRAGIPMMSTLGVFVPYFDARNQPLFRDNEPVPFKSRAAIADRCRRA